MSAKRDVQKVIQTQDYDLSGGDLINDQVLLRHKTLSLMTRSNAFNSLPDHTVYLCLCVVQDMFCEE